MRFLRIHATKEGFLPIGGVMDNCTAKPTGPYIALGVDAAFIAEKSYLTATEKFTMVSIPVPRLSLLSGESVYCLNERQENLYGLGLLAVNGLDFFANDLVLDNHVFPDSERSNIDLLREARLAEEEGDKGFVDTLILAANEADALTHHTSVATLNALSNQIDGVLDPARDLINAKEIIRNNPDHPGLRAGNALYLSGLAVLGTRDFNDSVSLLAPVTVNMDDYRVAMFIQSSGLEAPEGVSEEEHAEMVSELITAYQSSGDNNYHQVLFAYFQKYYGIDLSDEDDPTTAMVIGAAADAAKASPDHALLAVMNFLEAQAAKKQAQVGVTASAGVQFNVREAMQAEEWKEDLASLGSAVLLGSAQFVAATELSAGTVQPLTVVAIVSEHALGFGAAKFAGGDEKLLMANISSSNKFPAAVFDPRSVASLSYATNPNYLGEGEPNPQTSGLMWLAIAGNNAETVLNSGRVAGRYLRQAQTEGDPKKFTPVAAQLGSLLLTEGMLYYYARPQNLPGFYEKEWGELQNEYDFEDPFEGNDLNGDLLAAGVITLVVNVGAIGLGYGQEVLAEKVGAGRSQQARADTEWTGNLRDILGTAQLTGGPERAVLGAGVRFSF